MNHELILVTLAGVGGTVAAIIGGFTLTLVIDMSKETTRIIAELMRLEDKSNSQKGRFDLKVKNNHDRYVLGTIRRQSQLLTISLIIVLVVLNFSVFIPLIQLVESDYSERTTKRILIASLVSFGAAFTWLISLAGVIPAVPVFEVDDRHNLTRTYLRRELRLGRPLLTYLLASVLVIGLAFVLYDTLY